MKLEKIILAVSLISIGGCTSSNTITNQQMYGAIAGVIFDGSCGNNCFLNNATVQITKMQIGTLSNDSGKYYLNMVPVGTYSIYSQKVGYYQTEIINVRVAPDSVTQIDFPLISTAIPERPVIILSTESTLHRVPIK